MRRAWEGQKVSQFIFKIRVIAFMMVALGALSPPAGGSVSESTVKYVSNYSIKGVINPRKIETAGDWLTSTYLWGRLVRYGEVGAESGDLAKSWRRSPDGLKWIFELYPNPKWSDGSPMTAAEVVASLKESLSGTVHTKLSRYVREIRVAGENLVEFQLSKLPENFLFSLACPDFSITDPGKTLPVTGEYLGARFSGPYRVIRAEKGLLELERNSYYSGPRSETSPNKVLLTGSKGIEKSFSSLLENEVQVVSALEETVTIEQNALLRGQSEISNYWSSPDWTIALKFGRPALKKLTPEKRRWLLRAFWSRLHNEKSFGAAPATGIRPPLKLGGASITQMEGWLNELPNGETPTFNKPLDFFVLERHLKSRCMIQIEKVLKDLGVAYRLVVVAPDSDDKLWKRMDDSEYDFFLSFEGVADPDPDSAWRYMMEYYPGEKKPISADELDTAMLERDRVKRAKMYQTFEKRILENPFLIPLRMASSRIAIRKPWLPPAEGQFEWGVQLWMFQRE